MDGLRPDALVFDLDGTLWDAAAASAEGWNVALGELGVSRRVTIDDIRSVSGTPFARCVETLLPELGPPKEATIRHLEQHERGMIERTGGTLYGGVAQGLARLAARYPLFLVSNCPEWYLDAFLRTSGVGGHFAGWDCHGASGLPKAEMLRRLAQERGLKRALYVGDTQGDRDAAQAAGMGFVIASYGFGAVEGVSLAFSSFGELVDHFAADTRA